MTTPSTPEPENAIERYDRLADEFYRETGVWCPGKSWPEVCGPAPGGDWQQRCDAWQAWLAQRPTTGAQRRKDDR